MDNLAEIEGRYRLRHHLVTARIESPAGRSSRALPPAAVGREGAGARRAALRLAPSLRPRLNPDRRHARQPSAVVSPREADAHLGQIGAGAGHASVVGRPGFPYPAGRNRRVGDRAMPHLHQPIPVQPRDQVVEPGALGGGVIGLHPRAEVIERQARGLFAERAEDAQRLAAVVAVGAGEGDGGGGLGPVAAAPGRGPAGPAAC